MLLLLLSTVAVSHREQIPGLAIKKEEIFVSSTMSHKDFRRRAFSRSSAAASEIFKDRCIISTTKRCANGRCRNEKVGQTAGGIYGPYASTFETGQMMLSRKRESVNFFVLGVSLKYDRSGKLKKGRRICSKISFSRSDISTASLFASSSSDPSESVARRIIQEVDGKWKILR